MKEHIKELAIKKEKLAKEFSELPETVIAGIVAYGAGASRDVENDSLTLALHLIAWKEPGGDIINTRLILSKDITAEELKYFQETIKHESLIQCRVKLSKSSPYGDARALIISMLDSPDDADLNAFLKKHKEPVEISHPELGIFVLNKVLGIWDGKNESLGIGFTIDSLPSTESNMEIISRFIEWYTKTRIL